MRHVAVQVYERYKQTPGWRLVDTHSDRPLSKDEYAEGYLTAKFCLAPDGIGWGIRTNIAAFYGCIPVIIQDDVQQVLEQCGLPA